MENNNKLTMFDDSNTDDSQEKGKIKANTNVKGSKTLKPVMTDSNLYMRLKLYCTLHNKTMKSVVDSMIEKHITDDYQWKN